MIHIFRIKIIYEPPRGNRPRKFRVSTAVPRQFPPPGCTRWKAQFMCSRYAKQFDQSDNCVAPISSAFFRHKLRWRGRRRPPTDRSIRNTDLRHGTIVPCIVIRLTSIISFRAEVCQILRTFLPCRDSRYPVRSSQIQYARPFHDACVCLRSIDRGNAPAARTATNAPGKRSLRVGRSLISEPPFWRARRKPRAARSRRNKRDSHPVPPAGIPPHFFQYFQA